MFYLKEISWSLNEIDDKLALVTGVVTSSRVLSFEMSVHWVAKRALKWFDFSLKFDIRWQVLMGFSFHYREFSV